MSRHLPPVLTPGELLSRRERLSLGVSELLAALGQAATWPLVVFLGTSLQLDGTQLGWLLAMTGAGQLLSGLVAGRLCDRYGKRAVLEASVLLTALAWSAVALHPEVCTVVAAQALTGLGWSCFTASSAYLGAHSTAAERSNQFAVLLAWRGAGFTAGPLLAGLAMGFGLVWACAGLAAASVACAVAARTLLRESRVQDSPSLPVAASAWRLPATAWAPLAALMLLGTSNTVLGYYVPVHAQSGLNASPQFVATLFSCLGLTMVVAPAVLAGLRRCVDDRTAATGTFALVALASALCALATGVAGLTGAFFLWALAWDAANPLARSALSARVRPEDQAQVMAAQQWGQGALNLTLPPLAGWLYGQAGALPLFGLTTALSVVGVLVLWRCFHEPAPRPVVDIAA